MATINYTIKFHSPWHCGSGLAAGADVDLLVVKDAKGMPFVPGKTMKGLVREWAETINALHGYVKPSEIIESFGEIGSAMGCMFFENAVIPSNVANEIAHGKLEEYMYESISSTAIGADGIAMDHSLRKTEAVVPCDVEGRIMNVPECIVPLIEMSLKSIKHIGVNRNRGLGRCDVIINGREDNASLDSQQQYRNADRCCLKFKVKLLSDVILNVKSASEGNQSTLDFIPGNVFLGICAKTLYGQDSAQTHSIFHSGAVRFGDAHLGLNGYRGVKVPAVMHYPKLSESKGDIYLSHLITDFTKVAGLQLKQCRNGFYVFDGDEGTKIKVNSNFSIKSAHDRVNRTSMEGQMFGYESLSKGAEMYFTVELDDPSYSDAIENALTGIMHIGRSRTAQFGLVEIQPCEFKEYQSIECANDESTVYADGRLIFIDDETLMPTLRPTAAQLGFPEGEIVWSKCQLRHFQYAPWNFKRQCFDTDRCGFEKGSVFVVKANGKEAMANGYVGSYNNEGFGKVIINPSFLASKAVDAQVSKFKLGTAEQCQESIANAISDEESDKALLRYLKNAYDKDCRDHEIYGKVNDFVEKKASIFKNSAFASQWGAIRSLALSNKNPETLYDEIEYYLSHGVARDKWDEQLRSKVLMSFIKGITNNEDKRIAIINLASEMQKKCSK